LFETDAASSFDSTICVACSAATQLERLLPRGWSREQIEKRNQAQWPVGRKMELANYVVWTEGSLEMHAEQLRRIVP
jgi:dephospho-CoA kinase